MEGNALPVNNTQEAFSNLGVFCNNAISMGTAELSQNRNVIDYMKLILKQKRDRHKKN